jgi:hypothetical protein
MFWVRIPVRERKFIFCKKVTSGDTYSAFYSVGTEALFGS